jgi:uncharacterized membrane protein YfcA
LEHWVEYLICLLAALAAGFVNSIAGGGTLLTFPALVYSLGTEVMANTTSTVGLFPGSLAGAWGSRSHLKGIKTWLMILIPPSIVGGILGALMVTRFPQHFRVLVPWLLVLASTLFLIQPLISKPKTAELEGEGNPSKSLYTVLGLVLFQFLVAIYGGYFGAGIGILMIASLSFMGIPDIFRVNGLKNVLAFVINSVAALVFCLGAPMDWKFAGGMAFFSIIGGYLGGTFSQKIPRKMLRVVIISIGYLLASYYFFKVG